MARDVFGLVVPGDSSRELLDLIDASLPHTQIRMIGIVPWEEVIDLTFHFSKGTTRSADVAV